MQYVISFLEGISTFISPCLLPMLPIYISYFAGGGERSIRESFESAAAFMLTSTVLGLITMVLFKPRSWCVYCPMGTMTQLICKAKNGKV